MNQSRIDITFIRKEQIVDAAVCVIAQQGLQNFSLSEIEKKAHMSRGQLTYYFPAKEDILLAVFDRFLFLMQIDCQVQDKNTGKPFASLRFSILGELSYSLYFRNPFA